MAKENLNRRDFFKTSIKSFAIGSLALSALDVKKLMADADSGNSTEAAKVINLSDYPDLQNVGGSTSFGNTYVLRSGQSKFLALSLLCTHKKCSVEPTSDGFECPCHGSTFSGTGKVTHGPATKNLKSYKTTFNAEDNTLTINM
ncbi:MAG TPA: Rieske (2Fe-2S) protein [Ignavibacteria bacterium]|nr:Rieske (2Fe-2S) protein [Ignavibacteria bacterium]